MGMGREGSQFENLSESSHCEELQKVSHTFCHFFQTSGFRLHINTAAILAACLLILSADLKDCSCQLELILVMQEN